MSEQLVPSATNSGQFEGMVGWDKFSEPVKAPDVVNIINMLRPIISSKAGRITISVLNGCVVSRPVACRKRLKAVMMKPACKIQYLFLTLWRDIHKQTALMGGSVCSKWVTCL